jgi:hypothetical protein
MTDSLQRANGALDTIANGKETSPTMLRTCASAHQLTHTHTSSNGRHTVEKNIQDGEIDLGSQTRAHSQTDRQTRSRKFNQRFSCKRRNWWINRNKDEGKKEGELIQLRSLLHPTDGLLRWEFDGRRVGWGLNIKWELRNENLPPETENKITHNFPFPHFFVWHHSLFHFSWIFRGAASASFTTNFDRTQV